MRIIKKGRAQKGWAKEFECTGAGNTGGGCGAVLLVEMADLFMTESHARDETTCYVTFECPSCMTWTDVPDKDRPTLPPGGIRRRAPTRMP